MGLPPKTLARILRFQRVYRTLAADPRWEGAMLALDCGYYDQAHLIRDFRHFAGRSPQSRTTEEESLARLFGGG